MKTSSIVISTLIAVSLVGCSSAASLPSSDETFVAKPAPITTPTLPAPITNPTSPALDTTPKSPIPSPNAAQKESLLAELSKINPSIITAKTVNHARDQCSSLYPVTPSATQNAQARFSEYKGYKVTLEEAAAINNVILDNGFCTNQ